MITAPSPSNVTYFDELLALAVDAFNNGHIDAALALTDEVLKRDASQVRAGIFHLQLLIEREGVAGISPTFNTIPELRGVICTLVETFARRHSPGMRKNILVELLSLDPSSNDSQFALARSYADEGNISAVVELFRSRLSERPLDGTLLQSLVSLLAPKAMLIPAVQQWVGSISGDRCDLLMNLSGICHEHGWPEDARIIAALYFEQQQLKREQLGLNNLGFSVISRPLTEGMGAISQLSLDVKLRELGYETSRLLFLRDPRETANPTMLEYYGRYVDIIRDAKMCDGIERAVGGPLSREVAYLQHAGETFRDLHLQTRIEREWRQQNRPPLFSLRPEDEEYGWNTLRRFGVKPGRWFVTLHVRQNIQALQRGTFAARDVRDLTTYLRRLSSSRRTGDGLFRVGDKQMQPLRAMPGVIDLAGDDEFDHRLMVFLWAKCRFYMGVNSGPFLIPRDFAVSSLVLNWLPLYLRPSFHGDVFVPKLFRRRDNQALVSLSEMFERRLPYIENAATIGSLGYEIVDNRSDEIAAAVQEMMQRTSGDFQYSNEDVELQRRFNERLETFGLLGDTPIAISFLRKYQQLLLD